MFQRTLLTAMAVAAGALAAAALKTILEHKDDKKYDDDEEVRFIRISDDEEETAGYDASARSEQVQQICAVYPYLHPDFVEAKLAENEKLLEEYPPETMVALTHSVHFSDSNAAEEFSSIMEEAGYICVDRSDYAVAVTRKLFSEDNAIVSDILNVANQTAALNGTYENYEIQ